MPSAVTLGIKTEKVRLPFRSNAIPPRIGKQFWHVFTEVAICPNNNEIQVHKSTSNGWKLLQNLQVHDMHVMGIDWAPNTNRIVTCSADKNAYVWTQEADEKWNPAWVVLRLTRAATCVKWSPLGTMLISFNRIQ